MHRSSLVTYYLAFRHGTVLPQSWKFYEAVVHPDRPMPNAQHPTPQVQNLGEAKRG